MKVGRESRWSIFKLLLDWWRGRKMVVKEESDAPLEPDTSPIAIPGPDKKE